MKTSPLRIAACLLGVGLGGLWVLGAPEVLARIAGGLLFAGVGATLLVPGVGKKYWLEFLAGAGCLVLFMGASYVLVGVALLVPGIAWAAGRRWHAFQLSIIQGAAGSKGR